MTQILLDIGATPAPNYDPWAAWPVGLGDVSAERVRALASCVDDLWHATHRADAFALACDVWWCVLDRFAPGTEQRYVELVGGLRPEALRAIARGFAILQQHFFGEGEFADILGPVYMDLAGRWAKQSLGQYFTPWPICRLMASATLAQDIAERLEDGDVSVSDPACGSGAMLLAVRSVVAERFGRAASARVKCFGQDIDRVCVQMARIQLRLADERYMRDFLIASAGESQVHRRAEAA